MILQTMIEQGRTIIEETPEYYLWIERVEEYLTKLPNTCYIEQLQTTIKNCKELGYNSIRRRQGINRILAVLIQIDNHEEEFIQNNISKPLLSIFTDNRMLLVKREFEEAVQHLNEGRYIQAITEVSKSIESMMKEICRQKEITYTDKDTYSKLAQLLENHNVLPVKDMLAGHQRLRNAASAHGADSSTYELRKEDAVLEINRSAAVLVYLYEKSGMRESASRK